MVAAMESERVDKLSEVSLTDQLARILREGIADGTLPAGEKLPSEAELGAFHDVSRIVVRRALTRLEEEGLVFGAKGRGWFVRRREP
jgi:DNA-binding GntR family transcriptional regulator